MKRISVALLTLLFATSAFADTLRIKARDHFKPIAASTKLSKVEKAQVSLGRMLFFEPRLSKSQLISCNSCHNLSTGGVDLQETSTGHGWQKGPRNAPTVLNSGNQIAQFWDGRSPDLEDQAKGPVQAGVEMANTPAKVTETLKSIPEYSKAFKKAFPKQKSPVSFDNMAKAIASFEATLTTPGSKFDRFLTGKAKLSKPERRGLSLFMDKGCASCHGGTNLGGESFQVFGVANSPSEELRPKGDIGREKVTGKKADRFAYKVPVLRNIELTAPYFHTGKVHDLGKAVQVMGKTQLGVNFNAKETADIVAFLKTLTGKQPKVNHPELPPSSANTPLPVLD